MNSKNQTAGEIGEVADATAADVTIARAIPDTSLELRKQFPQLMAAFKGVQTAIKNSPAWKGPGWVEGQKLVKLPSATVVLKGTKDAPATVERREATLIRLGMPTTARAEFVASLVRYHEAWKAAGLDNGKDNAEVIEFD